MTGGSHSSRSFCSWWSTTAPCVKEIISRRPWIRTSKHPTLQQWLSASSPALMCPGSSETSKVHVERTIVTYGIWSLMRSKRQKVAEGGCWTKCGWGEHVCTEVGVGGADLGKLSSVWLACAHVRVYKGWSGAVANGRWLVLVLWGGEVPMTHALFSQCVWVCVCCTRLQLLQPCQANCQSCSRYTLHIATLFSGMF